MALVTHLSGGAGNTDPNASLGGVISTTTIVDAVNENLFDDIKRKEIVAGKTEFRCFYIKNTNASIPVHGAIVRIDAFPISSTVTIGLDPVGAGDGVATGVAQTIALEDTAPTGVIFEAPGTFPGISGDLTLSLPTILELETIAIWVKRVSGTASGGSEILGLTASGNEEALPASPAGSEIHAPDGLNMAGERFSIAASITPFKVGVARVGFSKVE